MKIRIVVLALWVMAQQVSAQSADNAIFWEVSGNGLTKPSYLFGTFHLLGNEYIDSLTNVTNKFRSCEIMVGEIVFDSTMMFKMMMTMQMKDSTLRQLLSEDDYTKTAAWVNELSGMDLQLFNKFNPVAIQIFIMGFLQQQLNATAKSSTVAMDLYFQHEMLKQGKDVIGLETLTEQLHALYGQFTYKRQAALLMQFVNEKEKALIELQKMNRLYRQQDLKGLEQMSYSDTYSAAEMDVMLDKRNLKWMEILPQLMKARSTFVAVGALHLSGKNGLVNLLRKKGFTVKPIPLI